MKSNGGRLSLCRIWCLFLSLCFSALPRYYFAVCHRLPWRFPGFGAFLRWPHTDGWERIGWGGGRRGAPARLADQPRPHHRRSLLLQCRHAADAMARAAGRASSRGCAGGWRADRAGYADGVWGGCSTTRPAHTSPAHHCLPPLIAKLVGHDLTPARRTTACHH